MMTSGASGAPARWSFVLPPRSPTPAQLRAADASEGTSPPQRTGAGSSVDGARTVGAGSPGGRKRPGPPRSLEERDERIRQAIVSRELLAQRLRDEARRRHNHRVSAVGGGLLALARSGTQGAIEVLEAVLDRLPKKEKAHRDFIDWDWRVTSEKAPVVPFHWVRKKR